MEQMEYMVPCLLGLERLVADELMKLKLPEVRAENGRVFCKGTLADLPRMNIQLRCGARVLLVLARFHAETFEELFQGTLSVPWEDIVPRDGESPVKGYSISSQLHSVPACQSIVKKAVSQRLCRAYGLEWLPETGERYQIQFSIMKDEVCLCVDTSGPGLYKRGYRAVGVEAPLRETLAAAMVLLSRYRGLDPFCDPFCGSGTICIEAALIAKKRAPGLNRHFAAQKWDIVDSRFWMDAVEEALDQEYDRVYDIWGGDIDANAVRIAQENAVKAEVEDTVRFEVADAGRFYAHEPYGRVVTNPPYGERLLEKEEAARLYHTFGAAVRRLPEGWRVSILSSHTEFEEAFGQRAKKKRKLYNGMIKCDLFQYGRV
ncbi:MAG: class I SAM-dependent RNA methyltransferase [Clostridiales bacterium]|nr:class I SAM-dependent RNA methyltransferase [Clostridiales bacterium]